MSDVIRKLVEETNALPPAEMPGWMAWAYNHPGIVTHKTKAQERMNADAKRAYFVEQAEKRVPEWFRTQPELIEASRRVNMDSLRSPYEPYAKEGQLLGEESPVWNAAVSFSSLPSAVYATGQMLANKVDQISGSPAVTYPEAYDRYAESMKNLGAAVGSRGELGEMRAEQDAIPWQAINPGPMEAHVQSKYKPHIIDGNEFLSRAGVDPTTAQVAGAGMDIMLDPFSSVSGATKLARMGKKLSAYGSLGSDALIGTHPAWIPPMLKAADPDGTLIRELLGAED